MEQVLAPRFEFKPKNPTNVAMPGFEGKTKGERSQSGSFAADEESQQSVGRMFGGTGGTQMGSKAADRKTYYNGAPPATSDRLGLTHREREVLALLAAGYTNRRIAESLFISESTAGVHVSNILGKLGVSNRVEAAAMAVRLSLAR